jgi:tetratricopeptide (TPR) repeat protein
VRLAAALCVLAPGLTLACLARGPVTRVADGETMEGRAIEPEAYAAYLRASALEARGDAPGAVAELERALDEDPESPEIVTRIARLLCAHGGASPEAGEEALDSFDDALALDPTYAPAWLGLAECRERRGNRSGALEAAELAAYYDPSSSAATRTVARLLFALGRPDDAFTWLEALVALFPKSREAEQALLDAAVARNDRAREARARSALAALGTADRKARDTALGDAIRRGDLGAARSLAVALSIRPSTLALLALDRAAPRVALEQARLVLAADPSDSDAWIAALAAADELGDDVAFSEALRALDADPLPPSERALEIFARLVQRHGGPEAAAALGAQRKP